ncbi:MAG: hypothetical protein Q8N53_13770 [Longimicrobiales bacterium]|nr:hypothetical protein [Longimicrobiales bacterium]
MELTLPSPDPVVKFAILRELGRCVSEFPLVQAVHRTTSPFALLWAEQPAARLFLKMLRDEDPEVRRQVLRELRPIFERWALDHDWGGNARWREELLRVAAEDARQEVRELGKEASVLIAESYDRVSSHPI